jgi:hypothetical protein
MSLDRELLLSRHSIFIASLFQRVSASVTNCITSLKGLQATAQHVRQHSHHGHRSSLKRLPLHATAQAMQQKAAQTMQQKAAQAASLYDWPKKGATRQMFVLATRGNGVWPQSCHGTYQIELDSIISRL